MRVPGDRLRERSTAGPAAIAVGDSVVSRCWMVPPPHWAQRPVVLTVTDAQTIYTKTEEGETGPLERGGGWGVGEGGGKEGAGEIHAAARAVCAAQTSGEIRKKAARGARGAARERE